MGSSQKIVNLLEIIKNLNDNEYKNLICQAFDKSRPPEVQRTIVKYFAKSGRGNAREERKKEESGVAQECTPVACPSQQVNISAWQSPLIIRMDLIPQNGNLYLDVEKLSLKKAIYEKIHQQVASIVALVNENRDLVFWAFICWCPQEVCQLFPQLTGLNKSKIKIGLALSEVQSLLGLCLSGRKLIGFDLKNDLKSLGVYHSRIEDLQDYFFETITDTQNPSEINKHPFKTRDLANHFLIKVTINATYTLQ